MIEQVDTRPDIDVPEAEYLRLLGYPRGHEPEGRAAALITWARAWYAEHGRPWVYVREATLEHAGGAVRLDGHEFGSGELRDHLRAVGATRAVLVAVSAGRACEERARRLWEDGRPDGYFFLEVYGSAVVEHLVASLSGRLCAAAARDDLLAVPHYSPGYSGWDVADQGKLFALLASRRTRAFPGPLEVMDSGMLRPKKSLLAVVGLTPRTEAARRELRASPCESCAFSPCQYRRATYRHVAVRIDGAPAPTSSPASAPRYTVNARALRKWSRERVRLEPRDDGTLAATFRFEGTTCSNLGHPLAFEYRVVLGAAEAGHLILEAACRPAPGDTGYTRMCAWITDGPALMEAVAAEQPLLGRPLEDVLAWERASAPSGCLCDARGRAHNWGLALETIHFAVAQAGASVADLPARCSA